MSLQFAEYLLTDLKDHFSKLTSKRYPLKWRISALQLPGVCLKTSLFNNGDEIEPNAAIHMILETEVPDFEIEICLCNDKPGERELIALCFANGAYLEHGIFYGSQSEKRKDPTEDALAYFQGVIDLLKGASLRQGPIKSIWLKIFQIALAAEPLDETRPLLDKLQAEVEKFHSHKSSFRGSATLLDKLQVEVEKLLSLLKDRQPGLMTWNMFLEERLETIQKMITELTQER